MIKSSSTGRLIVFEGVDGTGKSTQLTMAQKALKKHGYQTVSTREPTNGQYGKIIRALYENRDGVTKEEELTLFLNDRKEHVKTIILPALDDGKIVLCDRYFLSTAAYQGAVGFDPHEIIAQNSFAPNPDLALLFQIPIEISINRITENRGDTLNDFEQKENLKKVRDIFNSLNYSYIQHIDASPSADIVHKNVMKVVHKILK